MHEPPMTLKPFLSFLLSFLLCAGLGSGAPQPPAQDQPPAPQLPGLGRPVSFDDSLRIHDLVRAGSLYLGLQDALALAIENNLDVRSEEHTSELQSLRHLVCRLLLEKKNKNTHDRRQLSVYR